MRRYVMGFAFSKDLEKVLLILKNRPAHLAGFLTGPGGRIEALESPLDAVEREVSEETGLRISDWVPCERREVRGGTMDVFAATVTLDALSSARSLTDEMVRTCSIYALPKNTTSDTLLLLGCARARLWQACCEVDRKALSVAP
jgi:8-oxo-dGTP diphosphatase